MTTIHIEKHDGEYIVKFQADNPDVFKLLVETLKSFIRADLRRYSRGVRQWHVEGRAVASVYRWLNHARDVIHADIEWPDGTEFWDAPPPPPKRPKAPKRRPDAFATLHLLPSAPPELIKAAYRTLAQLHHPDHGGDTSAMQRINIAYKEIGAQRI